MSDYLNFSVQTRDDLCRWIERSLGAPLITVELTKDHLEDCINEAVEEYTKYVQQERSYLTLNLETYIADVGFVLPNNVSSVFAMEEQRYSEGSTTLGGSSNTLFSTPNMAFGNSTLLGYGGGFPNAGSFVTYEAAMQFMDLTKRMLASSFYFEYNQRNKHLTLIPDPLPHKMRGYVCIGVNVIRPEDQQFGESWVKKYSLALAKIKLGTIRAKFGGVTLLGGGTIDYGIKDEGITERDTLKEDLLAENSVPTFFMG